MYSKDFNFFLENQIAVACTNAGKHITFFSRLNGQCFKTVDDNKKMSDEDIKITCLDIHLELEYYD